MKAEAGDTEVEDASDEEAASWPVLFVSDSIETRFLRTAES